LEKSSLVSFSTLFRDHVLDLTSSPTMANKKAKAKKQARKKEAAQALERARVRKRGQQQEERNEEDQYGEKGLEADSGGDDAVAAVTIVGQAGDSVDAAADCKNNDGEDKKDEARLEDLEVSEQKKKTLPAKNLNQNPDTEAVQTTMGEVTIGQMDEHGEAVPSKQVTPSRDPDTKVDWPPRLPVSSTLSVDAKPYMPKLPAATGAGDELQMTKVRNVTGSSGSRHTRTFVAPTESRNQRAEFSRSAIMDGGGQRYAVQQRVFAPPREILPMQDFSKPPPPFAKPPASGEAANPAAADGGTAKKDVPPANHPVKHPLSSTWVLWYFRNENSNWESNLKKVSAFSTVEDFWALYHHLAPVSELKCGTSYFLFKEGIKPMWEDKSNVEGGRVVVPLVSNSQNVTALIVNVYLVYVGESQG